MNASTLPCAVAENANVADMLATEFSLYLAPYQAVYIDIAKVASSSIKMLLATALELEVPDGNPHAVAFPKPPQFNGYAENQFGDLFTFAFVRNPWDRLVSCYRDKIAGEVADFTGFAESGVAHCLDRFGVFEANMSFTAFVEAVAGIPDSEADEHFRSQVDFVTDTGGQVAIDFVGRYENLADDFSTVARTLGLPDHLALPHLQAASKKSYASYYSEHTWNLVSERYAQDISVFNYR